MGRDAEGAEGGEVRLGGVPLLAGEWSGRRVLMHFDVLIFKFYLLQCNVKQNLGPMYNI